MASRPSNPANANPKNEEKPMSFDLTGPDRENQVRRLASCGLSLFPVDSKKIPGKWKAFQTRPNTEP